MLLMNFSWSKCKWSSLQGLTTCGVNAFAQLTLISNSIIMSDFRWTIVNSSESAEFISSVYVVGKFNQYHVTSFMSLKTFIHEITVDSGSFCLVIVFIAMSTLLITTLSSSLPLFLIKEPWVYFQITENV